MAQIVKELRVDVSQPNVFQAIVAKQNDSNSRFLKITLVDFGVKVEVPNTAKVTINANRPDGASESFKGEANNDGTITVPLAQWMLDIDGEVKCDVSVINTEDNKRLTSTDFWLEVQKAANPNASIPLDPDGEILIIKPVTEINENSKDTDYPSAKAVYDYGQNIVTDTQITATASGSAITIESANAPLQNLKLYGKTTQDGTPTPTSPIELKSVGDSGSFNVGVYGKNLLEVTATTKTVNGVTFTVNADKSITVNGTATANVFFDLGMVKNELLRSKLILKGGVGGSWDTIIFYMPSYDATGEVGACTDWNGTGAKVNLKGETGWARIFVKSGYTVNNKTFYPMLYHESLTDTTYEPYKAKQSLTFTDTLRGAGEVADEKDFARGVTTQRFNVVDLGTLEDWVFNSNDKRLSALLTNSKTKARTGKGLCSIYNVLSNGESFAEIKNNSIYTADGRVFVHDNRYTDATTFKSAMSGIKFIYELETPIETPITEQELNAYRQLHTNKGTTTILSECEDTEVTYYVNKPNAQAIGNLHTQINKDYFKLQQAIISTGGSTL